jgi:hypothetical protein
MQKKRKLQNRTIEEDAVETEEEGVEKSRSDKKNKLRNQPT